MIELSETSKLLVVPGTQREIGIRIQRRLWKFSSILIDLMHLSYFKNL